MRYEDTITEVLDQYELSSAQREEITQLVLASPCPWFSAIVYTRTHVLAAKMEFTS